MEVLRWVVDLGFSHGEGENGGFAVAIEFLVDVDVVVGPRMFKVHATVVVP